MILAFQTDLIARIRQTVAEAFGVTLDEILVQTTPRLELGDMALPLAFDLAKKIGRKPRDIAQELAPKLNSVDGISRAEVAGGGFINLFLDRGAFTARLASFVGARARITVRGLGDRRLRVWGEDRTLHATNGVIADRFRGLQARIYIAAPPGLD